MANTIAKVYSYIALGYSLLASDTPTKDFSEESIEIPEDDTVVNNIEEDRIQPNKQMFQMLDIRTSGGMRV